MTGTTVPTDIMSFRSRLASKTGVNPVNIGIAPNKSHKAGGGYHCGCQDVKDIGKWGTAGSSSADYSVRQPRDRIGGNTSSALDMDDDWPRGGRAAWIRWNNYVSSELQHHPERLGGLRAINYTPDGSARKRYDSNNPGQGVINSTDTVTIHTHLEWWRDTIGNREVGFQRMLDLADDAIANVPARAYGTDAVSTPSPASEDDDMQTIQLNPDETSIPLIPKPGRKIWIINDAFRGQVDDPVFGAYALRVWWAPGTDTPGGNPNFGPLGGLENGLLVRRSGERWWTDIPANCELISIKRMWWNVSAQKIESPDPANGKIPYMGSLGVAIG